MKASNSGKPELHLIGNAHLDLAWLWRWEEAREEMINTSRTVLQLMEEYPDFVYTCSQAAAYVWVEEAEPELFAKIQEKVKEGRWKIVGGWWVQPDVNIPSGESFIRQALYGKLYFREKFGVDVKTGYNVDSFGHTAQLPQILRHVGIENYVFFRPKPNEKILPATLFQWKAPDGTTVLASRPPFHYNSWAKELDSWLELAVDEIDPEVGEEMLFYGVGDHGGGPTRENIRSILNRRKSLAEKVAILFSDPETFFANVKNKKHQRPVVAEELQYHSRGCYTSHSDIKRWNRFLENFLTETEKIASVLAVFKNLDFDTGALEKAWKTLLFHQFHDILAGTSIPSVYVDAEEELTNALMETAQVEDGIIQKYFSALPTQMENEMVVLNTLVSPRPRVISTKVHLNGNFAAVRVKSPSGQSLPVQVHEQIFHPDEGSFLEISFQDDLPALGYKTYLIEGVENSAPNFEEREIQSIESDFYKIIFDTKTGWIEQIYDKENDVEVLSRPGNRLVVIHDPYDTWGHDVNEFREEVGSFELTGPIILEEDGPVFKKVRVDSRFNHSTARQTLFLYKNLRRIDFELTVDWEEQFKMLKLAFPVKLQEYQARFEVPFGAVGRPAYGTEEPLQRWMDVSGYVKTKGKLEKRYGVALLNDSKYGGDIKLTEMRLTILRSPIFAKHSHGIPEDLTGLEFLDQGEQTVRYALLPHASAWNRAHLAREAEAFENRPKTYWRKAGFEPQEESFLEVRPENVILSAFKRRERGEGWILRLYESEGRSETATIYFPSLRKELRVPFRPFEIKTFLLQKNQNAVKIYEANGLEEVQDDARPLKWR